MRARTTSDHLAMPVTARGRALSIMLWVLQLLMAFQFAGGGWLKLRGTPVMVELFDAIGAGQWLRLLVGALEVAGALGLLVPRLCGLAALGLSALMLGATATNLLILGANPRQEGVFVPTAGYSALAQQAREARTVLSQSSTRVIAAPGTVCI